MGALFPGEFSFHPERVKTRPGIIECTVRLGLHFKINFDFATNCLAVCALSFSLNVLFHDYGGLRDCITSTTIAHEFHFESIAVTTQ